MDRFDTLTTYQQEDRARRFEVKTMRGTRMGVYRTRKAAEAKQTKTVHQTYIVEFLQYA